MSLLMRQLYTQGYDFDLFHNEDGVLCFDLIDWYTGEVVDTYEQK